MGLVWGLMTTGMNAITFWMPLILDATLRSDDPLAEESAGAKGAEETSMHHDQLVSEMLANFSPRSSPYPPGW